MSDTGITVRAEMTASHPDLEENFIRWYGEAEGLRLFELRSVATESDFSNGRWLRESPDNGRTWSEPRSVYENAFLHAGEKDEILYHSFDPSVYDPVSGCLVSCGMLRYFIGGHTAAYEVFWRTGEDTFRDHCYLVYRTPDGTLHQQFVAFEDGPDYDPENPRNPAYLDRNRAYFGNIRFASNGDLLFPVGADVTSCCRILGLRVEDVFPSCPQIMCGMILIRAHWEPDKGKYTMTYSRPVVISDLMSSRGVCEPCVCELPTGRILVVFRGSNVSFSGWNTRIEPYAPGFKWYTFSDDGGKTFSPAMPWHFNTREVVYSSATLSSFFRSSKTGHTYWIGNITDPSKTCGNRPRWPLYICQVDDSCGVLMKETLTMIDTRREGEADTVQLSNFTLIENRETQELEIRLCKIQSREGAEHGSYSESWTYYVTME